MEAGRTLLESAPVAMRRAILLSAGIAAAQLVRYPLAHDQQGLQPLLEPFLRLWFPALVEVLGILAVIAIGHPAMRATARQVARIAGFLALWMIASAVGIASAEAGRLIAGPFDLSGLPSLPSLYRIQFSCMLALALLAVREFETRSADRRRALREAREERQRLDVDLAEARHELLRAQIEPHFLFNSLANLRRLAKTDKAAARSMLDDLLRYLQEALPRLREERSTLGNEIELVRAYIAVHRVRMGQRLQARIDVPPELEQVPVPPLAVLTLVENSIKHGLQPKVEGGSIAIDARREGDLLVLEVADDGVGMGSTLGHGTGLTNLRARMRAENGASATLSLRLNYPQGVVVRLQLPVRAP